jgi:putative acetyltransferase
MVTIRSEKPSDIPAIFEVNQSAFDQPGEAMVVDGLRERGELRVSLVAEVDGKVVGHIAFSPMRVETENKPEGAFGLAPMAVEPKYQGTGIGLKLIAAGLEACREAGAEIVIVLGHPEYYPRAGFERASLHGISSEFDVRDEVFMVQELTPGALEKYSGVAYYSPLFRSVT